MPSKARSKGRTGRPWKRIVAAIRQRGQALGLPCSLCGHPIDYTLPYNHAMSFTVEHKIPLDRAPWLAEDPSNLTAAHRRCNSRKGNRPHIPTLPTSEQW